MKYNEFDVEYYSQKEIKRINTEYDEAISMGETPKREKVNINTLISKVPSKRKFVMIKKLSADTNNFYRHSTGKLYELAEVESIEGDSRENLKAWAEELSIEFPKNIKTEKLIELINEKQK